MHALAKETSGAGYAALADVSRHRLTREDFHRMGEVGILTDDARVELIGGEIYDMAPIGSFHAACVAQLTRTFATQVGSQAIVWVQNPIGLGSHSERQPDCTLLRFRDDFYRHVHPAAKDVLLLVEVADSARADREQGKHPARVFVVADSARADREWKIPLYAKHGIGEVWLVDLTANCLEIYRQPRPEYSDYQQIQRLHDSMAAPESLPDVAVDVAALFTE